MKTLGDMTPYGRIAGIQTKGGERYYFCIKAGVVSYMPAVAIEI